MIAGPSPAGVAVAMLGARMHYAVPHALHRLAMLRAFFTDFHVPEWQGALLRGVGALVASPAVTRAGTRASGIPGRLVTTFPSFGREYRRRLARATSEAERVNAYLWGGERFCRLVWGSWREGTKLLYAFNSAALELFERCAERGVASVLEQVSTPHRIDLRYLAEAAARFPGWLDGAAEVTRADEAYAERERAEWDAAGIVLAPSEFVRESLLAERCPAEKVRVVPYAVDTPRSTNEPSRGDGRQVVALFVGQVGLRKGAPVLAEAARRLQRPVTFRAVGSVVVPSAMRDALASVVSVAGPLPRSRVWGEYARADMFVFPSFCEGSATVVYEALAAGLPVVTTPNAGSVVRDGVEGFLVPAGDVDCFVDRVERLAGDRSLRETMGAAARRRAQAFTVQAYGARLLDVLRTSLEGSDG